MLYTFSYSFLTSASFGFLYNEEMNGAWGVAVSFASAGITGVFMAIFGGQPAVLYGQTGPVVLLYLYVYTVAEIAQIPYGPWVAWIGVWSFAMHAIIALFAINDLKTVVTRFTAEIFEVLVAADYITSAVIGILGAFKLKAYNCSANTALCSLNGFSTLFLALAFYCTALKISGFQKTVRWSSARLLRRASRFGALLTLVGFSILSYVPQWVEAPGWPSQGIPNRVPVPGWGETAHDFLAFARMGDVPNWAVWSAAVPALLLTILFYVDQNLSTMAAASGLRSPEAFNLDFLLLGVTVLITGLLGLPASSGLIPQNPMHTRSLRLSCETNDAAPEYAEQRLSNLGHSLLLLVTTFMLPIVGVIPTGVLWGAFLLLASEAYHTEFVQRSLLMVTSSTMKQREHSQWGDMAHILNQVPKRAVAVFNLIQGSSFLTLYVVAVLLKIVFPIADGHNWVVVGSVFPVLVCLLAVPLRSHILPRLLDSSHLDVLDGAGHGDASSAKSKDFQDGIVDEVLSVPPHESRVRSLPSLSSLMPANHDLDV